MRSSPPPPQICSSLVLALECCHTQGRERVGKGSFDYSPGNGQSELTNSSSRLEFAEAKATVTPRLSDCEHAFDSRGD